MNDIKQYILPGSVYIDIDNFLNNDFGTQFKPVTNNKFKFIAQEPLKVPLNPESFTEEEIARIESFMKFPAICKTCGNKALSFSKLCKHYDWLQLKRRMKALNKNKYKPYKKRIPNERE